MPPKRKKTQLHEEGDAKTTPVLAEKRDDGGGEEEEEPTTAAAASACKRSRKDENEQARPSPTASSSPSYAFVVDKAHRRFLFLGVYACRPHCGTNAFTYDNNRPGVKAPDRLVEPSWEAPTPTNILAAVRRHYGGFVIDQYH